MAKHHYSLKWFFIAAILSTAVVYATLHAPSQQAPSDKTRTTKPHQAEDIDTSTFPIAEFDQIDVDPVERRKREAKGKKYNARSKYDPPITELRDRTFLTIDWDVGLPAFPIDQSSAIISGRVVSARAHLSPDRTNVYSEFQVDIHEVFKRDSFVSLEPGASVVVERQGGRVRFPSGKIMVSVVNHQEMPKVGSFYLLFLTHQGLTVPVSPEDFFILTGYEFRGGQATPLDKILPGHPISAYKGVAVDKFLKDFSAAMRGSSGEAK